MSPEEIRQLFPALHQQINDNPLVYLDSAASTQKPMQVLDCIADFYQKDYANVHRGAHKLSSHATFAYEHVRDQILKFVKADESHQVIFTSGTTSGINTVAFGLEPSLKAGDLILIDGAAHHANIVPWQEVAQRQQAKIMPISLNRDGTINQTHYQALLKLRPKIVALNHVGNVLGATNPIQTLCEQAKAIGATVLVDGAQAIAHLPLNLSTIPCDFYLFSAHKMYGPTGVGAIVGKTLALDKLRPLMYGGEMIKKVTFAGTTYGELPNRLEAGTPPIGEVIGLGASIDFINQFDREALHRQQVQLHGYAINRLKKLNNITLISSDNALGVIAFNLANEHPTDVAAILDNQGIALRAGHHCAMPLMQSLQLDRGCVRASFSIYNTQSDVDALIEGLILAEELLC